MQALTTEQIRALIARGKMKDTVFQAVGILCLALGLLVIFLLVGDMLLRGMEHLNLEFFTSFASRKAAQSGILSAWVGTILVMFVTALAAVPVPITTRSMPLSPANSVSVWPAVVEAKRTSSLSLVLPVSLISAAVWSVASVNR